MSNRIFQRMMILAFCSAAVFASGAVSGQPNRSAGNASDSTASTLIGEAKAAEIALDQAGGGQVVDMKLKRKKRGEPVYSALVVDGGSRIAVEVDATSGVVTKLDRENIERVDYPRKRHDGREQPETAVDFDKARKIALERSGGGTVVGIEKEFKKNGRVLYEVDVIDDGRKCEIEIDAQTGAIVEYQEKLPRF